MKIKSVALIVHFQGHINEFLYIIAYGDKLSYFALYLNCLFTNLIYLYKKISLDIIHVMYESVS